MKTEAEKIVEAADGLYLATLGGEVIFDTPDRARTIALPVEGLTVEQVRKKIHQRGHANGNGRDKDGFPPARE